MDFALIAIVIMVNIGCLIYFIFTKEKKTLPDAQMGILCREEVINDIIISTGGISKEFEVIDNIFSTDTVFAGADPDKALEKVKQELAAKCRSLNGNAVLNCRFEYRAPNRTAGCFGVVDIFAYGTAVKSV